MSSIFTVLIALLWPPAPVHVHTITIEDRRQNSECFACDFSKYTDGRDPLVRAKEALAFGFIRMQNANTPLARALGADDLRALGADDLLRENDYARRR